MQTSPHGRDASPSSSKNTTAPKGKTCCKTGLARMRQPASWGGAVTGIAAHSARSISNVRAEVMKNVTLDQDEETILIYEIRDEALEAAARPRNEKVDPFTQSMCTALYFCPGP
jgi:hypothetical protein